MLVSKVGRVGGWQLAAVAAYWIELGGRASMAGHWSPNQTLLTLDCNKSFLSHLLASETSLTSNWERINVKLIRDSHKRRAIIAILPLCVLWTGGVCLKLQQFDA